MRKANRPAFPTYGFYEDGRSIITGGLTKREYAAIQIMAASAGGGRSSPEHIARSRRRQRYRGLKRP